MLCCSILLCCHGLLSSASLICFTADILTEKLTRGCSSGSALTGALVTEAFSFAAPVFLFGAVALYSRVPLDASDRESSAIAAARWRGGAIANGAEQKVRIVINGVCVLCR